VPGAARRWRRCCAVGAPVHDVAPIRVADRVRLLGLNVTDRGFGYPLESSMRAVGAGWRIREIDVP
jgi:hypothetical protein